MKFPQPFPRFALFLMSAAAVLTLSFFLWESPQFASQPIRAAFYSQFAAADDVTKTIRDPANSLVRVRVEKQADRQAASNLGQIVADHGSDVIVAAASLPPSLPGGISRVETSINLPGKSFEPLNSTPAGTVAAYSTAPETGYYIVQFGVTPTDELLDSLRDAGTEIVQYVPHQAFIVYGSGDAIGRAAAHSRVRWVGRYAREHKTSSILREQLSAAKTGRRPTKGIGPAGRTSRNLAIFDVAVFSNADLGSAALEIVQATSGKVRAVISVPNNFFNLVRIEADVRRIEDAANVEAVFSIESWGKPRKEDEVAAQIVAGNYSGNVIDPPGYDPLTQFGVDGQGVTVAVADDGVGIPGDGGFYITSSNTVNGPLRGASAGANGHGHLQASIIAGDTPYSVLDPNGYNYGSGIAPKANLVNIPILRSGYGGTEADALNDAITTAGPNGVNGYIVNNSWGYTGSTNDNVYESSAALYDGFVRDASVAGTIDPVVLIFSAGNSGTDGLTRPKIAKNLIAVGATENIRPTLDSSGGSTGDADDLEQLPDFSSRGPAADTRVKPDIVAPGDAVTGGRSGADDLFGNIDSFHRVSSGTSHAAPQVAGAAALFLQYWKANHSGLNASPAMVKAALINGAVEVTGSGASSPRPNGSEGWGRVNLKNVLNTGTSMTYVDQTTALNSVGELRNFVGTVPDNSRPVRVSLVWTDPPGAADPAVVNDLDLEVLVGGNKYRGNVFTGGSSITGGSADSRNNVENVFLPPGVSGPVTIRVIAKALNGNGILGNADATDQNFALVVYNGDVSLSSGPSPEGGQPAVISGNNLIEPSECNFVNIPLTNYGQSTMTGVTATLSTTSPGVQVTGASANYPDIAPGATANNSIPYQVSTTNAVACASNVNLVLTVSYSEMAAPAVFNLELRVGSPPAENYSFTASSGATISTEGTLITGSDADDVVVPFTAPFSFSVYDTAVPAGSAIRLSTNGQIRIESAGSTGYAASNEALPSTGGAGNPFPANLPVLLPYWDDLDLRNSTTIGGGIYSEVTGSPGSQTLKLEWRARNYVAGQAQDFPNVQFAVYFHENSNSFEYVYAETGRSGVAFVSGSSATVGVQGATAGSTFTQYSSNTPSLSQGLMLSATRPAGTCAPGFGPCVLTAADVSISGRILTPEGRGVRGVTVTVTDREGDIFRTMSNSFGYFRVDGIPAGETVVLSAYSRSYTFSPSILTLSADVSGLVMIAER